MAKKSRIETEKEAFEKRFEKVIIKVSIQTGEILVDNREEKHWTFQQQTEMRDANYRKTKWEGI